MSERRLYLAGLYAIKLDLDLVDVTEGADGRVTWRMKDGGAVPLNSTGGGLFAPVGLYACAIVASSEQGARAFALERAFSFWPKAEGWANHFVTLNPFPRHLLLEALRHAPEDEQAQGDRDLPDLIM